MKATHQPTIGEAAARVLAGLEVDDRFLDDTGRPLDIDDRVIVMTGRHLACTGLVVGLDELDDGTGEPKGDPTVFVRLDNVNWLVAFHPARLRYMRKASA